MCKFCKKKFVPTQLDNHIKSCDKKRFGGTTNKKHDKVIKDDVFTVKELFKMQLKLRYGISPVKNEALQEGLNYKKKMNPGSDDAITKLMKFNTPETHYSEEIADSVINYLLSLEINRPFSIGLTAIGSGTFIEHLADILEKKKLDSIIHLFDNSQFFLNETQNNIRNTNYTFVDFQVYLTDISDPKTYPENIRLDLLFGIELLDCLPEKYSIRKGKKRYELLFQLTNEKGNIIPKDHAIKKIDAWFNNQRVPKNFYWQILVGDLDEQIKPYSKEILVVEPSLDFFTFAKKVDASHIIMIDYFANKLLFQNILERESNNRYSLRFKDKRQENLETPSVQNGKIQFIKIPMGLDVTFAPDTDFYLQTAKEKGYNSHFNGVWLEFVLDNLSFEMKKQFSEKVFGFIRRATIVYLRKIYNEFGGLYQRMLIHEITNLPLMRSFSSIEDGFVSQTILSKKDLIEFASAYTNTNQQLDEFYQMITGHLVFFNQGLLMLTKKN